MLKFILPLLLLPLLAQAEIVQLQDGVLPNFLLVNPDGSINVNSSGGGGGGSGDGAILDGSNAFLKATVTAGHALKTDASATTQPVSAASLPLPAGAATSAKQDALLSALGSPMQEHTTLGSPVACKLVLADGSAFYDATGGGGGGLTDAQLRATPVPVSGTFFQSTQPVSIATMPSTPVTGTFWQATQPVSGPLTDAQLRASSVPVSGTFFQATQPVSGPLTDAQLRASGVPVTGTFFQATQPISGTVTANAGSGTMLVDGSGHTQPVSGTVAATESGTWNITNVSGTVSLPTGASTATKQDTGNTSLASIDDKETNFQATTYGPTTGALDLILFSVDTQGWGGGTISFLASTASGAGATEAHLVVEYRNSTSDAWQNDAIGFKSQDGTTFQTGELALTASSVNVDYGTLIIIPKGRYIRGHMTVYDHPSGETNYTANLVLRKLAPVILPVQSSVSISNDMTNPVPVNIGFESETELFTAPGNGTVVNVLATPRKVFSLQVNKTGAVTSWDVVLEGSLNASTWTTILEHTNTTPGDGKLVSTGALLTPVLYYRTRAVALTLGGGTNILTTMMGMN